MTETVSLELVS